MPLLPRPIIIDTDPGQDDAVAILLALASPELEVLGITAVAGNVPLHLTELNARKIVDLSERTDVPVFAGADRPMGRDLVTAEHVHGKTGLDGPDLPDPVTPLDPKPAVEFIVETVMARDGVTLCTLGPLTNIALAMQAEPRIVPRIREIVAMGGGFFEGGNITPAAEFNIYVDPEAADIVFNAGVPLTLMPLDVTHKALTTRARVDRFRAAGNRACIAVAELIGFFERFDETKYGHEGAPLHDPNVIAWLLRPEIYSGRQISVQVEKSSPLTLGMTVADWWRVTDRPANAFFVRDLDADAFFDLLIDRISTLPRKPDREPAAA